MIYESLGAVWVSKPCATRDCSSLVFYESLGAVLVVEPMRHPLQQFVDYF
jgi:hypothetical protein